VYLEGDVNLLFNMMTTGVVLDSEVQNFIWGQTARSFGHVFRADMFFALSRLNDVLKRFRITA